MVLFNCDYHEGAHPAIMERMMATNMEQTVGYGEDGHCAHAKELIRRAVEDSSVDVHFLVGGTQTNTTVIAAALRPYQGVVTAVSGHINCHETGAIESTGHKVIGLPSNDGKLTAKQIHDYYVWHKTNESYEHIVMPKMVYIFQIRQNTAHYIQRQSLKKSVRYAVRMDFICSLTAHA